MRPSRPLSSLGDWTRDRLLRAIAIGLVLMIPQRPVLAQSVLEVPPAARASGMGLAQVAVARDANAAWWNPAALGCAEWSQAATWTYRRVQVFSPEAFGYLHLGYATRIEGVGAIAADFSYIGYGTAVATSPEGQFLGEYTLYMLAPAAAFGSKVSDELAIGVGFKVVHAFIHPEGSAPADINSRATSVALDGGLLWSSTNRPLSVGLVVQNLGPGLEYAEGSSDPLPRSLRGGVGYQAVSMADHGLLLAADLDQPLLKWYSGPKLNLGTEYVFHRTLAVRFGWIYEGWYQDIEPINDPTFGLGVRIGWFSFDYATLPLDTEARNWLITFGAAF